VISDGLDLNYFLYYNKPFIIYDDYY